MTDIGESIAIGVITNEPDGPCWYCEEEEKQEGPVSNIERGDVAGWLKKVKKKKELSWIKDGDSGGAAHHLIPVKSMDRVSQLHKYIEEKHGVIESDIGYDLNHPNNAVWLPATPLPASSEKDERIALIKKANSQFHQGNHPDYRTNVRGILAELHNKIKKDENDKKCPICDKEMDSKQKPPYGLVGRLDAISSKLRSLLTGMPKSWLLDDNYFTFSRGTKTQVKNWIDDGSL